VRGGHGADARVVVLSEPTRHETTSKWLVRFQPSCERQDRHARRSPATELQSRGLHIAAGSPSVLDEQDVTTLHMAVRGEQESVSAGRALLRGHTITRQELDLG
jgi:hypothetical protein